MVHYTSQVFSHQICETFVLSHYAKYSWVTLGPGLVLQTIALEMMFTEVEEDSCMTSKSFCLFCTRTLPDLLSNSPRTLVAQT